MVARQSENDRRPTEQNNNPAPSFEEIPLESTTTTPTPPRPERISIEDVDRVTNNRPGENRQGEEGTEGLRLAKRRRWYYPSFLENLLHRLLSR